MKPAFWVFFYPYGMAIFLRTITKTGKVNDKLVYLLEDDTDLQRTIQIILSREGYEVLTFGTAQGFKQQINLKLPDLCIVDVNLPDGNGMDISIALTADPFTSQVPVVLMSANPYQRDKYQNAGAWHFISKPFKIGDLLDMIGKLT